MALATLLYSLRRKLSPRASILTDPSDITFQDALRRWSDVGLQMPGALVKVTTEADATTTVSET